MEAVVNGAFAGGVELVGYIVVFACFDFFDEFGDAFEVFFIFDRLLFAGFDNFV